MSPAGSGPISLRAASMAARVGWSPKLPLAGSTNWGSPKIGADVAREVAVVGVPDKSAGLEVGSPVVVDVIEEKVVLELAPAVDADRGVPPVRTRATANSSSWRRCHSSPAG